MNATAFVTHYLHLWVVRYSCHYPFLKKYCDNAHTDLITCGNRLTAKKNSGNEKH